MGGSLWRFDRVNVKYGSCTGEGPHFDAGFRDEALDITAIKGSSLGEMQERLFKAGFLSTSNNVDRGKCEQGMEERGA